MDEQFEEYLPEINEPVVFDEMTVLQLVDSALADPGIGGSGTDFAYEQGDGGDGNINIHRGEIAGVHTEEGKIYSQSTREKSVGKESERVEVIFDHIELSEIEVSDTHDDHRAQTFEADSRTVQGTAELTAGEEVTFPTHGTEVGGFEKLIDQGVGTPGVAPGPEPANTVEAPVRLLELEQEDPEIEVEDVTGTVTLDVTPNASGAEGSNININISAVPSLPSSTLTIELTGFPSGGTFNNGSSGGPGIWNLTTGDLAGLQYIPPAQDNTDFTLNVAAISTPPIGTPSVETATIAVDVVGVVDPFIVNLDTNESGPEGAAIAIAPLSATLGDLDGSESLQMVTISNVPIGGIFSAGTMVAPTVWEFMPGDLVGLTLTPPAGDNSDFILSVTATVVENDGASATSVAQTLPVAVVGSVDLPITVSVNSPTVTEGNPATISGTVNLTDTDGSEAVDFVQISGVPAGATFNVGTNMGSGVWQFTEAQFNGGVQLTHPTGDNSDFALSVTAQVSDDGNTATTPAAASNVTVNGAVDLPITVSVNSPTVTEGNPATISGTVNLTDTDGSEAVDFVQISGVPAGATFNVGTNMGSGVWQFTEAQFNGGVQLTHPTGDNSDFALSVTAQVSDDGNTATTPAAASNVTVNGAVDLPITVSVNSPTVTEGNPATISGTVNLTDTDGSEIVDFVQISGVPAGATFNVGTNMGSGVWQFTEAQFNGGVQLTHPTGDNSDFALSVTAQVSDDGSSATTPAAASNVTVTGAPDSVTVNASSVGGNEDTAIPLTITAALTDTDGSETLDYVRISGVPAGSSFNQGTDLTGGVWQFTIAQLSGLTITPPLHDDTDLSLTVTAFNTDDGTQGSTAAALNVTVTAVADTPNLTAPTVSGTTAANIPLNITTSLVDTDGSETLSITISGVTGGASLSTGTNMGSGVWVLTPAQATVVEYVPGTAGVYNLSVSATATETSNADTATNGPINQQVTVVAPVALFTQADDTIVFSAVGTGFDSATFTNALAGNDTVTLSDTGPAGYVSTSDFHGGEGDDTITGETANNRIFGDAGDDTIVAGDGADYVEGGTGNDNLTGGIGADTLHGGDGNDTIFAGRQDDTTTGGEGHDTFIFRGTLDDVSGPEGHDTITGGVGEIDSIDITAGISTGPGGGQWTLTTGAAYTITGGQLLFNSPDASGSITFSASANNSITFSQIEHIIWGTETSLFTTGNDTVSFSSVGSGFNIASFYNGLSGNDLINVTNTGPVGYDPTRQFNGGDGDDTIQGTTDANRFFGDDGNDTLLGRRNDDYLDGGAGDDNLQGLRHDDTMFGGTGSDTFSYRANITTMGDSEGHDTITGGVGAGDIDTIDFPTGITQGPGLGQWILTTSDAYTVSGNQLVFSGFDASGTITFNATANNSITFSEIERIEWGSVSVLFTGSGDTVNFSSVTAGANDPVSYYDALGGNDTVNYSAGSPDPLFDPTAQFNAGNGNDNVTSHATLSANILGGDGNDTLTSGSAADILYGENGNDTFDPGAGADTIVGGADADTLQYRILTSNDNDYFDGGDTTTTGTDTDIIVLLDVTSAPGGGDWTVSSATGFTTGATSIVFNTANASGTLTSVSTGDIVSFNNIEEIHWQ